MPLRLLAGRVTLLSWPTSKCPGQPMQDYLLDILILGLLVLLFVATSRQRTSRRLRLWTCGWVLILIHFAVLVIPHTSTFAATC